MKIQLLVSSERTIPMKIKKKNMKFLELKKLAEYQSIILNKNIYKNTMIWNILKGIWRYLMKLSHKRED